MQLPIHNSAIIFCSTTIKSKLTCPWLNPCHRCAPKPVPAPTESSPSLSSSTGILKNYPLSAAQTSETHHEGHQTEWILWAFPVVIVGALPPATGRGLSSSRRQRAPLAVGGSARAHATAPLRRITRGMTSAVSEKRAWRFTFPISSKRCDYVPRNGLPAPVYPLPGVLRSSAGRLLNLEAPHNWLSKRIVSTFFSHKDIQLPQCTDW